MTIHNKYLRAQLACSVVLALGISGCSKTPPSGQLQAARQAYQQATQTGAATVDPDSMHQSREALRRAEFFYEEEPQSQEERHFAYVATRKAQIAMGATAEQMAQRAAGEAKQQTLDAARRDRDRAESDATYTSAELSQTKDQLKSAEQARAEAEARLADAEAKLRTAMAGIAEMAQVKARERDLVITLNGAVLFEFGKSKLMSIAEDRLRTVAEAIKSQDENRKIVIEGHTDAVGADAANEKLSKDRAESVRQFLISEGIPAERVTAVGKGEQQPVATNDTPEGRANNRRVEIVLRDNGSQATSPPESH